MVHNWQQSNTLRATVFSVLAWTAESQQRGDDFVVAPLPGSGGCRGVAEFLGCFKDDKWDPNNYGKQGGKPPAGEHQHRALPYAVPGCYNCHDGITPDSKENPNPCKTAPDPPACDKTKMTDDYCATLCLHWAQSGNIPGAAVDEIYSATQFSFTCWCGTSADASELVSVDDKQCNKPCEGDKSMMCGGNSLNHVMHVTCSRWGWTFIEACLVCATCYVVVGMLYTHRTHGVPLTKAELLAGSLIPNRAFWKVLRGLVTDGVRFSRAKLCGHASVPAGGYIPVGSGTAARSVYGGDTARAGHSNADEGRGRSDQNRNRNKHVKEKSAKRSSSNSRHGSTGTKKKGKTKQSSEGTTEEHQAQNKVIGGSVGEEGATTAARELTEQRDDAGGLHASQAKIKVIGING